MICPILLQGYTITSNLVTLSRLGDLAVVTDFLGGFQAEFEESR